jgi:hypothetical protein
MDPGSAVILSALIASAASAGSSAYGAHRVKKIKQKESKLRAHEARRETFADLVDQANARRADLSGMRLANAAGASKKRSNAMQNTAQTFREALLNV